MYVYLSIFGEMSHRLWGNEPPTLRQAVTDFGEMPSPILGKSATDFTEIVHRFEEICLRVWGNLSPALGKPVADF